ncbi:hypothetical protein [Sulfurirhabdus autotrophica]|nr:hypothetical protein [Sulfurirhabdus autotrophica]
MNKCLSHFKPADRSRSLFSFRYAIALVMSFISLLYIQSASACSCILLNEKQQFDMAEHVFIARITHIQETKNRPSHPQWRGKLGEFNVEQILKGKPAILQTIETGFGRGDCGVSLTVGHTYLFFADKTGSVDICTGSREFDSSTQENQTLLKKLEGYALQ